MVSGVIAVESGGNVQCFRGSAGMWRIIMGHYRAIISWGTDGRGIKAETHRQEGAVILLPELLSSVFP